MRYLLALLAAIGLAFLSAVHVWPFSALSQVRADSAPLWESPVGLAPGMPGGKVRMASETVDIKIIERGSKVLAVVDANFELYNPSATIRMPVGFPTFSLLSQQIGGVYFDPKSQRLRNFRAWSGLDIYTPREARMEGMPWAVWEMVFPASDTIPLQVSYEQQLADLNDAGLAWLFYVMTTGALWDDDIGEAVITVAAPQGLLMDASPEAAYLSASRAVWRWRDIEPTEDIGLVYVPEVTRVVLASLDKAITNGTATSEEYMSGARAVRGMTGFLGGHYPPTLKFHLVPKALDWAMAVAKDQPENAEAWETIGYFRHLDAQGKKFLRCWPAQAEEAYQRAAELGSTSAAEALEGMYDTRRWMAEVGFGELAACE